MKRRHLTLPLTVASLLISQLLFAEYLKPLPFADKDKCIVLEGEAQKETDKADPANVLRPLKVAIPEKCSMYSYKDQLLAISLPQRKTRQIDNFQISLFYQLNDRLRPGNYRIAAAVGQGGKGTSTFRIFTGKNFENLTEQTKFRLNFKSWQRPWQQGGIFTIQPGDKILEVKISGRAQQQVHVDAFCLIETQDKPKQEAATEKKKATSTIPPLQLVKVSQVQRPVALTFLGDSLTHNMVYPRLTHAAMQKAGLATDKFACHAYPSKTAKYIIELMNSGKLTLVPKTGHTDLAFIMIGTNAYIKQDLVELVSMVNAKGYQVVILTPPPRRGPNPNSGAGGPGSNRAYNNWIRSYFPKLSRQTLYNVQFIDIVPPLLDKDIPTSRGEWLAPEYNADNTHLKKDGYALIADTIVTQLKACNWLQQNTP